MQKSKQYWIYGKHAVLAAIQNPDREIERLIVTKQALEFLEDANIDLHNLNIQYAVEKAEVIASRAETQSSQGIALQTRPLIQQNIEEYVTHTSSSILVILDQVSDPQNIGSIIRTAAAFGGGALITPSDHSPKETSSMVKAAAGSFESMPFISVTNLVTAIKFLKKHGYWAVGMDHNASHFLHKTDLGFDKIALVLGSEEYGIRPLVKSNCDLLLKIPMKAGNMDSINVSNAASIALYAIALVKN